MIGSLSAMLLFSLPMEKLQVPSSLMRWVMVSLMSLSPSTSQ